MKLAYLTGEYPRATDTFIQREVAALRDLGFTVDTCSIRRTGTHHHVGPEQKAEAAQTFYTLRAARNPVRLIAAHAATLGRAPGRYLRALWLALRLSPGGLRAMLFQLAYFAEAGVLADHLHRQGTEHLHNHIATGAGTVALLASELTGIPFSFTLHGPGIFFEPDRWRLDVKIARARFTACISSFARSQAMLFSDPAHWPRLAIVHCGVDPALYADAPPPNGKHLIFVGRLAAVKGVPVLFEALAEVLKAHPDARLTLIGDGPDRRALEKQAWETGLGAATSFTGYAAQADVARALAEADIFVLPSFAEGVPVVLMEALAAGRPVVATQVGGVGELVEDGLSGRLVPPGDAHALARVLIGLLDDADARVRMGAVGRAKVRADFTSCGEAVKLAALFREGKR